MRLDMKLRYGIARLLSWFMAPMTDAPEPARIIVMISLIGRSRSGDWDHTCERLSDTLAALQAQSYGSFQVVLACQDRPSVFPDDPRFTFLKVPDFDTGRKKTGDQTQKIRAMSAWAAQTETKFAYVHHLDGDDILHPELFAEIAADNNGRGYVLEGGIILDHRSGEAASFGVTPPQVPFWRHCGSSAFLGVDFSRPRWAKLRLLLIGKRHLHYAGLSAAMGIPLDPIAKHRAIYLFNHGLNQQTLRGNDKRDLFEACALTAEQTAALRQEFRF